MRFAPDMMCSILSDSPTFYAAAAHAFFITVYYSVVGLYHGLSIQLYVDSELF